MEDFKKNQFNNSELIQGSVQLFEKYGILCLKIQCSHNKGISKPKFGYFNS